MSRALSCLIYRLRRKGFAIRTAERLILIPYAQPPPALPNPLLRLHREFHFNIQYIVT